jgi:predicted PurR-regulated permease PerM
MSEISYKSIFKIVSVIGLIFLLSKVIEVLIILFISVILSSAIKPAIKQLDRLKIPKTIGTMIVVFGSVGLFAFIIYTGIQPIIKEVSYFVSHFGDFLDQISKNYNIQIPNRDDLSTLVKNSFGSFGGQVGSSAGQLFQLGSGFINALLSTLGLIALTFYQVNEDHKTRNFISNFFGAKSNKVRNIIDRSERKLGSWFVGQLSLMCFIFAITYFSIFIIGRTNETISTFALPLAIIAGILEIVPVLGPTLALLPAIFVGASVSPFYAFVILILYLGIQQVEANIVIPRVMNKAVGLDPIIVILGIMMGNQLAGALGSLLSVPVMAVLSVLYEESQTLD